MVSWQQAIIDGSSCFQVAKISLFIDRQDKTSLRIVVKDNSDVGGIDKIVVIDVIESEPTSWDGECSRLAGQVRSFPKRKADKGAF